MLLTFKERFVAPILAGEKIHTIRDDKYRRWKVGRRIHFWKGNPRNPQKKPFRFGTGVVCAVCDIVIMSHLDQAHLYKPEGVVILRGWELDELAQNDGLRNWEELRDFFPDYFRGVVIYWKDFKPEEQPANH